MANLNNDSAAAGGFQPTGSRDSDPVAGYYPAPQPVTPATPPVSAPGVSPATDQSFSEPAGFDLGLDATNLPDRVGPSAQPVPSLWRGRPRNPLAYLLVGIVVVAAIVAVLVGVFLTPVSQPDSSGPAPAAVPAAVQLDPPQAVEAPINLTDFSAAQTHTFGGSGSEYIHNVLVGADGTVVASGTSTSNDGDLTGLNPAAPTLVDTTLVIQPAGASQLTTHPQYQISAAALAPDGNIIAAGMLADPATQVMRPALFKVTADGQILWSQASIPDSVTVISALAVAPNGRIVLLGAGLDSNGGSSAVRVASFDSAGNLQWTQSYPEFTSWNGMMLDLALAPDGGAYLSGYQANPGDDDLSGSQVGVVAKIDSTGALVWNQRYGDTGLTAFNAVAVAPDGTIIVAGETGGLTTDVGYSHGGRDALLAKFDENGTMLWGRTYGGEGTDYFRSLAVADTGDIVAAGYTQSTAGDFATSRSGTGGQGDALLAETDAQSNLLWSTVVGGSLYDAFESVAIGGNGTIAAVGSTQSTDGDFPASKGGGDGLVSVIPPS